MESWKGRKRPWEEDNPIYLQFKRRDSTTTAPTANTSRQPSPLPPRAGYYSRDSRLLNQRRLPPLYQPPCTTTAVPATTGQDQAASQAHQSYTIAEHPRPRSQSLFNVFEHAHWQDHGHYTERPIVHHRTPDLDTSPPLLGAEAHRPRFGTGPAPHAAGALICCPSNCQGQECLIARTLTRNLAAELTLLQSRVSTITHSDYHASEEVGRPLYCTISVTGDNVIAHFFQCLQC
ncbi:hypothetical protein BKA63DRAFT_257642 [Paraphoma chrysanthemicola]|nr:hypothetical protein BKA63DRAFT_257642 [Paraphoma chrysanthemicola]